MRPTSSRLALALALALSGVAVRPAAAEGDGRFTAESLPAGWAIAGETEIPEAFLRKLDVKDGVWRGAFEPSKLGPDEIELLAVVRQFRRRVELAARELDPAVICDYLRDLSGAYQHYYEYGNHEVARRVLHDDEAVRRAKLAASGAVQQTLRNGFALLGVSAPEQM